MGGQLGFRGLVRPPVSLDPFELARRGLSMTRTGPLVYHGIVNEDGSFNAAGRAGTVATDQGGAYIGTFHSVPAGSQNHPANAGVALDAGESVELVSITQTGGMGAGDAIGGIAVANFIPSAAGEVSGNLFNRSAATQRVVVGHGLNNEAWLMGDNGSPVSLGAVATTTNKFYLKVFATSGGAFRATASVNGGTEQTINLNAGAYAYHYAGQGGGASFQQWPGMYRVVTRSAD